jgi:hypothetical protein
MNDLIETFGEKGLSTPKQRLIYNVVRGLDPLEFTKVCEFFIGNNKFAPTVEDFRERSRSYLASKAQAEPVPCSMCKTSGILNVRKKTGEVGEYAFACTCQNGLQYPAFPRWRDSYRDTFTMQLVSKELVADFYGYEIKGKKGNLKIQGGE